MDHEQGYSGTRAAQIVGITYRQLDYWARTDLVRPSLADASGSGSRRRYSYRDLLELRMISGTNVVLCNGDELVDAVRRGQGVLNVLPLASVKNEIDEAVVAFDRRANGAAAAAAAGA